MSAPSIRMTKARKVSIAGIATAGAAAITLSLVPAGATPAEAAPVNAKAAPAAVSAEAVQAAVLSTGADAQKSSLDTQVQAAVEKAVQAKADTKNAAEAAVKKATAEVAAKKAAAANAAKKAAAAPAAAPKTYANNLDGWIREALDIMDKHDIPGTYNGLHRNIIRESSGNPRAINNWDINAQNGIPSKGLLQVIQPTFNAYHVKGTPFDLYHPVANIVAAANYAADRYGTIDNVFGAY
ncbi:transglycosylase SLT domain-containing protein [Streptomyces sp. NPDC094448]|uniref:transglycosylase SLT domain-containing protein n=1 Tax=Streptomyces sp. NPDC094448 TaxID=3366063 RepID=UPI00380BE43E